MELNIKDTDKILIIAPHPDDEVIACGGFMAKYHNQIDVLCINSSGVESPNNTLSAEEIADIRCEEFYNVMKKAGIQKYYVAKIWGIPPMIKQINKHFQEYMDNFDFKKYDYIFVPHAHDNHKEHRYVGNKLLRRFLLKSGYKQNLKIVRYELWSTISSPNCFVDITDFLQEKIDLIDTYESRKPSYYAKRITALNCYRTLQFYFFNPDKYVEAYYIEDVVDYLHKITFSKIFSVKRESCDTKNSRIILTIFGFKIKIKVKK